MSLQFCNKALVIVVAGNSGSGKSTYVIRYLLNGRFVCRFIFDPRGEYSARLKRRPARIAAELFAQIPTGWVIFSPHTMFPGNVNRAFEMFCEWVFIVSGKMSGQKILFVDEVWKHCSPNKIPLPLATIVQDGRKNGIGLITSTQRPNRINEAILNEANELVCFRLRGKNARKTIEELEEEFPVAQLPNLPPLHFISLNLDDGKESRGVLKF